MIVKVPWYLFQRDGHEIDVEIPTAALVAELEARRPCEKCLSAHFLALAKNELENKGEKHE